jgi:hypothetical protein
MNEPKSIIWTLSAIMFTMSLFLGCTRDGAKLLEKYKEYYASDFIKPEYKFEVFEYEFEGIIYFETAFYKKIVIRYDDQVSDTCMYEKEYWQFVFTDRTTKTTPENYEFAKKHNTRSAEAHIRYRCRIDSLDYLSNLPGSFDRDYRILHDGKYYK